MKVKEYFAKYSDGLKNDGTYVESVRSMIDEMLAECVSLCKIRHVGSDSALFSILKEMNQRYNAVCRMFDPPVIEENGFKMLVDSTLIPEAKGKW